MPKAPRKTSEADRLRHNPLAEDYSPTTPHQKHKSPKRRKLSQDAEDGSNGYVDTKASQRILRIGQDLIEEDKVQQKADQPNPAFDVRSRATSGTDGGVALGVDDAEEPAEFGDEHSAWGSEEEEVEEIEIDPADQDIFNRFHPTNADADPSAISLDALGGSSRPPDAEDEDGAPTNLTALILSKIAEHEESTAHGATLDSQHMVDAPATPPPEEDEPLPPAAVQVYTQIGQLLHTYRSGPLPKPLKILPSLPPFQLSRLLDLTNPPQWSPHAHLAALRLFISTKPEIATPYLQNILLPKVRDDIQDTRKLNVHLYAALKKSLYKPASFFKGILFPLLEGTAPGGSNGDCTLREAQILASVVSRVRIPVLHSAAALLRCCDIAAEHFSASTADGGGSPTNLFIRTLLEKKYALPFKVIDALVFHFSRFKALKNRLREEDGYVRLPVIWHQGFLAFAQRYRNDITEDQREVLLDVLNAVGHREIGKEIRRELLEGRGRGVMEGGDLMMGGGGNEAPQLAALDIAGGDDTMVGA